ncbi:hypothetical protein ADUPG1_003462, partial [Aduncisulcus paluster]
MHFISSKHDQKSELETAKNPMSLTVIERNGKLLLDDEAHEPKDKVAGDLELTAKPVVQVPDKGEVPGDLSGASHGRIARRNCKPCSSIGVPDVLHTMPTRKGNVAPGHPET